MPAVFAVCCSGGFLSDAFGNCLEFRKDLIHWLDFARRLEPGEVFGRRPIILCSAMWCSLAKVAITLSAFGARAS